MQLVRDYDQMQWVDDLVLLVYLEIVGFVIMIKCNARRNTNPNARRITNSNARHIINLLKCLMKCSREEVELLKCELAYELVFYFVLL